MIFAESEQLKNQCKCITSSRVDEMYYFRAQN